MARGLNYQIYRVEGLYYLCSKKITCVVTAQLICGFVLAMQKADFLMIYFKCLFSKIFFCSQVRFSFTSFKNFRIVICHKNMGVVAWQADCPLCMISVMSSNLVANTLLLWRLLPLKLIQKEEVVSLWQTNRH